VRVRSVFGQKIGIASSNSLEPQALKDLVNTSEGLARLQVEDHDFKSLPTPSDSAPLATVAGPDNATYDSSPQGRADGAGIICRKAREAGVNASGSFQTRGYEIAVVNSLGISAYHRGAIADLTTVVMGDTGSGYAQRMSPRIAEIDAAEVADEAISKTLRSKDPQALEPGDYEVILEEYAVAEMLLYMSYLGMGALSLQEGRSFMQLGRKLMSNSVTIYDDGNNPAGMLLPFDMEGVARQRVDLIKNGVCEGVVWDSYTAGREPGRHTTGHSIGLISEGPVAMNIFMQPGSSTKADMLKNIKRGLWVTRFHYVNPLVPDKAVLTGMTRDGTFLIENGEIVAPVKNFRFTQSAVEALNRVEAIGSTTRMHSSYNGGVTVPALHIKQFTFNSATAF
jgi:predicted Zn-dependent protease